MLMWSAGSVASDEAGNNRASCIVDRAPRIMSPEARQHLVPEPLASIAK